MGLDLMSDTDRERLLIMVMTASAFVNRFYHLEPGESLVYHRGFLAVDKVGNRELCKICRLIAKENKVILTQRKIGRGFWEYVITKPKRKEREVKR